MNTIAFAVPLILLTACASGPNGSRSSLTAPDDAFQQQRRAADARARETGDERPYPEGWVGLPRKSDPAITESIRLGQTITEVAAIMGRDGWSHTMTRSEFLNRLRT